MRIFYSWQSDLPAASNKHFIKTCLESAIKKLNAVAVVESVRRSDDFGEAKPLELDHDTKGVAGLPDLASTIFEKIAASDIFVADVSIIKAGTGTERPVSVSMMTVFGQARRSLAQSMDVLK
jgi:hypothetical protein